VDHPVQDGGRELTKAPSGRRASARRLSGAARARVRADGSGAVCGLERPSYFAGQLLSAKDLQDEQDYFRARLRRRNRRLHGAGVVSGLTVSVRPGSGRTRPSVVVEPGFAIDPRGEEIDVCRRTTVPLPARGARLIVQVLFAERPVSPVPAPGPEGLPGEGGRRYSRIEETFAVALAPVARPDAVPIARLTRRSGRWQVDQSFEPPRVRK
jgi:hypothetical protein